jgi:hypothetical protein
MEIASMSSVNAYASSPSKFTIVGKPRYEKEVKDVVKVLREETRPPFYNKKPRDEDELKAVVHAICRCMIDPFVKRERGGARVSDKECKFDFSMFEDRDALEVKLIKENRRRGEIIPEIIEDINAFNNSQFKNLLFLIYDSIGDIYDENSFKKDLERDNIHIMIVKH